MVKPSLFLDSRRPGSLQQAAQVAAQSAAAEAPSWALARVLTTPEQEPDLPAGWVRVGIPHDNPVSEATGLTDGGITAVGAVVLVVFDSTGRVVSISSPIVMPEGSEPVATGALGRRLQQAAAEVAHVTEKVTREVSRVGREIAAAVERTKVVERGLTAAQAAAEAAAQAGRDALARMQGIERQAASLEGTVGDLSSQVRTAREGLAATRQAADAATAKAAQAGRDAAAAMAEARKPGADPQARQQAEQAAQAAEAARSLAQAAQAKLVEAQKAVQAAEAKASRAESRVERVEATTEALRSTASQAEARAAAAQAEAQAAQAAADALALGVRQWWPNPEFDPRLMLLGLDSAERPPVGRARLVDRRDHSGPGAQAWFPISSGVVVEVEVTAKRIRGDKPLRVGLHVSPVASINNGQNFFDALRAPQVTDLGGGWARYAGRVTVTGAQRYGRVWVAIDQPSAPGGPTAWLVSDLRVWDATAAERVEAAQATADQAAQKAVDLSRRADKLDARMLAAQKAADRATGLATTASKQVISLPRAPRDSDGRGAPTGAWAFHVDGVTTVAAYQWDGSHWQQRRAGGDYLAHGVFDAVHARQGFLSRLEAAHGRLGSANIGEVTAEKLRAAVGRLDVGFIRSLLADSAVIKRIITEALTIAPTGNLIPDGAGEAGGTLGDQAGWEWDQSQRAYRCEARRYSFSVDLPDIPLQAGEEYLAEIDVRSSKPGQRIYVRHEHPGGAIAPRWEGVAPGSPSGSYTVTDYTIATANQWVTVATAGVASAQVLSRVTLWVNHSNGTTTDAVLWVRLRLRRRTGAIDIRNGSITTPMLKATSDMWAKLLTVAGNATIGGDLIAAGAIKAKHITVTEDLVAKIASFLKVTTQMLVAGNATIPGRAVVGELVGNTIRGARIISGSNPSNNITLSDKLEVRSGGKITNRVSDANGVEVLDTRSNRMVSLSAMLFGNTVKQWTGSWWVQGPATVNEWYGPWTHKEISRFRATTPTLAVLWHCRAKHHPEWKQTGFYPLYGGLSLRKPGDNKYIYVGPYPDGSALQGQPDAVSAQNVPMADAYTTNFGYTDKLVVGQEYVIELWFRHGNANYTHNGVNYFYPKYTTDFSLIEMLTWAL